MSHLNTSVISAATGHESDDSVQQQGIMGVVFFTGMTAEMLQMRWFQDFILLEGSASWLFDVITKLNGH